MLYTIKNYLGVGTVRAYSSYAVYSISNAQYLLTVLIPLLDKYNLRTTKYLNYVDFKQTLELLSSY